MILNEFQELIKLINGLSKEDYFDTSEHDFIELEHPAYYKDEGRKFSMMIEYNRPSSFAIHQDIFQLWKVDDVLRINFERKSEQKIPGFELPIPKSIEKLFWYDINLGQRAIFKKLLKDINSFFDSYNYRDKYYHRLANY
jgi:hypothetical protein